MEVVGQCPNLAVVDELRFDVEDVERVVSRDGALADRVRVELVAPVVAVVERVHVEVLRREEEGRVGESAGGLGPGADHNRPNSMPPFM